jgi:protein-L-isoaspartate(D-aspartate) O-methyltransferase
MVEDQLRTRGIRDERVLAAMGKVQRHLFVSENLQDRAYDDSALPIGEGQTISQPYMVALMTELLELKGHEKVLEIGTGSGYQAAVLSLLALEVFSVERVELLALGARRLMEKLEYANVRIIVSDGTAGLPQESPFDGIIVAAGAPEIPQQYIDQLEDNGRLVIPVGSRYSQILYNIRKTVEGIKTSFSTACVFVPLIGESGWKDAEDY